MYNKIRKDCQQLKRRLSIFLLLFTLLPLNFTAEAAVKEIYVDSKYGSENALGTSSSPFKSLEAAKEYIRNINADMSDDIIVNIKSGEYIVEDTLKFSEKDSASNGHKIIYRGIGDTAPVISGGRKITGWELYDKEKNIYRANAKGIDARAFFVNNRLAVRARSENNYLSDQMSFTNDRTGFVTTYTDIANWKNQSEIEMVFSCLWATPRVFVNSIIKDGDKAYIKPNGTFGQINYFNFATAIKSTPLYFENVFELLDTAGEFYIDKSDDFIYYIPRADEDMTTADAVLPVMESVVDVKGTDADNKVTGIVFENISFKHSDWGFVSKTRGIYDRQANIPMRWFADGFTVGEYTNPGIVNVKFAKDCMFKNCEFSLSGGAGLNYSDAVQDSPVTGNYIHDTYSSGIFMGEVNESSFYSAPSRKEEYNSGNHITNNYICDVGTVYEGACGLFVGYVQNTKIEHNEFTRMPYSAISVGWGWAQWVTNSAYANDTQGTITRNVDINRNYIHDIGTGTMVDGGGIYMLGATGGSLSDMNECKENYIKDLGKLGAALYPDEGSTYWDFESNVVDVDENQIGGYDHLVRWAHIHQPTIFHITMKNTYSTTREKYNMSTASEIEDAHYVPDRNWNEEALSIIKNAGPTEEYSERFKKYKGVRSAVSKIVSDDIVKIKSDESIQYSYETYNDCYEKIENATISYEIADSNVLKIENDIFTGIKRGKTDVTVIAQKDGYDTKKVITVYVDDEIAEVFYKNKDNEFVVGDKPNFEITAKTLLGLEISEPEVKYSSDNEKILQVDSNGKADIVGAGECNLITEVTYDGKTQTFKKPIKVKLTNQFDLSSHNVINMGNAFSDFANWNVEWYKEKRGEKGIAFATNGGFALYGGRKYGNEILDFDFTIEADGGWPTILLRAKDLTSNPLSGNTAYFIGLKADCIELQMFKNGQRYLYYGTLSGYDAIAGEAFKNVYYKFNERNNIKIGAVTEENGVRIVVIINGHQVMNYLDTTEHAIREKGYFGAICYDGKMVYQEPTQRTTELIQIEEKVLTDTEIAIENGFVTNEEYKTIMLNDGKVSIGEFTACVNRVLGIKYDNDLIKDMDYVSKSIYKNDVMAAINKGLVDANLLKNNYIDCGRFITREEAVSVIINALGGADLSDTQAVDFSDADLTSSWAKKYMQTAIKKGIIIGDSNSLIRPSDILKMNEMSTLLVKLSASVK